MKKSTKYAVNFAIDGGIVGAFSNVLIQLDEIDKNPNQKFDFGRLLLTTCTCAAVGSAGGYIVGGIIDYNNSKKVPLNTDGFLFDIINEGRLNKSEPIYLKLNHVADQIINKLQHEYHGRLSSVPLKLGSTEKGTALKEIGKMSIIFD